MTKDVNKDYLLSLCPVDREVSELKVVEDLGVALCLLLGVGVVQAQVHPPVVGAEPPVTGSVLRIIMCMGNKL